MSSYLRSAFSSLFVGIADYIPSLSPLIGPILKNFLHKKLGQFFDISKFQLKSLKDLEFNNVELKKDEINSRFLSRSAFIIDSGTIGKLTMNIPINDLFSQPSCVEINDIVIEMRPNLHNIHHNLYTTPINTGNKSTKTTTNQSQELQQQQKNFDPSKVSELKTVFLQVLLAMNVRVSNVIIKCYVNVRNSNNSSTCHDDPYLLLRIDCMQNNLNDKKGEEEDKVPIDSSNAKHKKRSEQQQHLHCQTSLVISSIDISVPSNRDIHQPQQQQQSILNIPTTTISVQYSAATPNNNNRSNTNSTTDRNNLRRIEFDCTIPSIECIVQPYQLQLVLQLLNIVECWKKQKDSLGLLAISKDDEIKNQIIQCNTHFINQIVAVPSQDQSKESEQLESHTSFECNQDVDDDSVDSLLFESLASIIPDGFHNSSQIDDESTQQTFFEQSLIHDSLEFSSHNLLNQSLLDRMVNLEKRAELMSSIDSQESHSIPLSIELRLTLITLSVAALKSNVTLDESYQQRKWMAAYHQKAPKGNPSINTEIPVNHFSFRTSGFSLLFTRHSLTNPSFECVVDCSKFTIADVTWVSVSNEKQSMSSSGLSAGSHCCVNYVFVFERESEQQSQQHSKTSYQQNHHRKPNNKLLVKQHFLDQLPTATTVHANTHTPSVFEEHVRDKFPKLFSEFSMKNPSENNQLRQQGLVEIVKTKHKGSVVTSMNLSIHLSEVFLRFDGKMLVDIKLLKSAIQLSQKLHFDTPKNVANVLATLRETEQKKDISIAVDILRCDILAYSLSLSESSSEKEITYPTWGCCCEMARHVPSNRKATKQVGGYAQEYIRIVITQPDLHLSSTREVNVNFTEINADLVLARQSAQTSHRPERLVHIGRNIVLTKDRKDAVELNLVYPSILKYAMNGEQSQNEPPVANKDTLTILIVDQPSEEGDSLRKQTSSISSKSPLLSSSLSSNIPTDGYFKPDEQSIDHSQIKTGFRIGIPILELSFSDTSISHLQRFLLSFKSLEAFPFPAIASQTLQPISKHKQQSYQLQVLVSELNIYYTSSTVSASLPLTIHAKDCCLAYLLQKEYSISDNTKTTSHMNIGIDSFVVIDSDLPHLAAPSTVSLTSQQKEQAKDNFPQNYYLFRIRSLFLPQIAQSQILIYPMNLLNRLNSPSNFYEVLDLYGQSCDSFSSLDSLHHDDSLSPSSSYQILAVKNVSKRIKESIQFSCELTMKSKSQLQQSCSLLKEKKLLLINSFNLSSITIALFPLLNSRLIYCLLTSVVQLTHITATTTNTATTQDHLARETLFDLKIDMPSSPMNSISNRCGLSDIKIDIQPTPDIQFLLSSSKKSQKYGAQSLLTYELLKSLTNLTSSTLKPNTRLLHSSRCIISFEGISLEQLQITTLKTMTGEKTSSEQIIKKEMCFHLPRVSISILSHNDSIDIGSDPPMIDFFFSRLSNNILASLGLDTMLVLFDVRIDFSQICSSISVHQIQLTLHKDSLEAIKKFVDVAVPLFKDIHSKHEEHRNHLLNAFKIKSEKEHQLSQQSFNSDRNMTPLDLSSTAHSFSFNQNLHTQLITENKQQIQQETQELSQQIDQNVCDEYDDDDDEVMKQINDLDFNNETTEEESNNPPQTQNENIQTENAAQRQTSNNESNSIHDDSFEVIEITRESTHRSQLFCYDRSSSSTIPTTAGISFRIDRISINLYDDQSLDFLSVNPSYSQSSDLYYYSPLFQTSAGQAINKSPQLLVHSSPSHISSLSNLQLLDSKILSYSTPPPSDSSSTINPIIPHCRNDMKILNVREKRASKADSFAFTVTEMLLVVGQSSKPDCQDIDVSIASITGKSVGSIYPTLWTTAIDRIDQLDENYAQTEAKQHQPFLFSSFNLQKNENSKQLSIPLLDLHVHPAIQVSLSASTTSFFLRFLEKDSTTSDKPSDFIPISSLIRIAQSGHPVISRFAHMLPIPTLDLSSDKLSESSSLSHQVSPESSNTLTIDSFSIPTMSIYLSNKKEDVNFHSLLGKGKEGLLQMINIGDIQGIELTLIPVSLKSIPLHKLLASVTSLYSKEIISNQKWQLASKLPVIKNILRIGSGIVDLVAIPLDYYAEGRSVFEGTRAGISNLITATTEESLNLTHSLLSSLTSLLLRNAKTCKQAISSAKQYFAEGKSSHASTDTSKQLSNIKTDCAVDDGNTKKQKNTEEKKKSNK